MNTQREKKANREEILERCLAAFIKAGTIDLSLDALSESVGISKRMLVHYFGGREGIEEGAMTVLENRLRVQFAPQSFPPHVSPQKVVMTLWQQTTAPQAKGVLLVVMDVTRRAWNGSARARKFYAEQQRLWVALLMKFLHNRQLVEDVLQAFQGAVLAYLITGDSQPGSRSLRRILSHDPRLKKRDKIGHNEVTGREKYGLQS